MTAVSDRAEADRAASERTAAEVRAGEQKDGDAKPSKLEQLRARYRWLDHLVRAGARYTDHHGDHYAAAITFFSILSLVPLLMIAFAVAGYVLFFNPNLLNEIRDAINAALPPNLADTINPIIDQAIAQRNTVAAFGLLTALYSGIGWMTNLREALSEQWAQSPDPPALPKRLLFDLTRALRSRDRAGRLVRDHRRGLRLRRGPADAGRAGRPGLGAVPPATAGRPARAHRELPGVPLGDRPPAPPAHADPQRGEGGPARGGRLRDAQAGHDHLPGSITNTPSGAVFGSLLGLLVFVNFVSRFILFVTAWAATAPGVEKEAPAPIPAPAVIRPEVVVRSGPNNATAVGLLGMGAVTALLGLRAFGRRR